MALPPRAPSRAGSQPRVIAPFVEVIDGWLRRDLALKGSLIHERLRAEYGFTGSYQRVKMHLAEARRGSPPSSPSGTRNAARAAVAPLSPSREGATRRRSGRGRALFVGNG